MNKHFTQESTRIHKKHDIQSVKKVIRMLLLNIQDMQFFYLLIQIFLLFIILADPKGIQKPTNDIITIKITGKVPQIWCESQLEY